MKVLRAAVSSIKGSRLRAPRGARAAKALEEQVRKALVWWPFLAYSHNEKRVGITLIR